MQLPQAPQSKKEEHLKKKKKLMILCTYKFWIIESE